MNSSLFMCYISWTMNSYMTSCVWRISWLGNHTWNQVYQGSRTAAVLSLSDSDQSAAPLRLPCLQVQWLCLTCNQCQPEWPPASQAGQGPGSLSANWVGHSDCDSDPVLPALTVVIHSKLQLLTLSQTGHWAQLVIRWVSELIGIFPLNWPDFSHRNFKAIFWRLKA